MLGITALAILGEQAGVDSLGVEHHPEVLVSGWIVGICLVEPWTLIHPEVSVECLSVVWNWSSFSSGADACEGHHRYK